jgi:GNAT superfamily N-acetyltransferase
VTESRVRLVPMSEAEFRASRDRSIERHAEEHVHAGVWTSKHAQRESRREFAQLLPKGRRTPSYRFCRVLDASTGTPVGETWFSVRMKGGRVQFWVDWIWIRPSSRRKGYGSDLLRLLEEMARARGADRIGLHVLAGNTRAIALYSKVGYQMTSHRMAKRLG